LTALKDRALDERLATARFEAQARLAGAEIN
jgi:hypothetical protein